MPPRKNATPAKPAKAPRKKQAAKGDLVLFVARQIGFHGGARQRVGATFYAPNDMKFSWAELANPDDVAQEQGGDVHLLEKPITDILAALPGLSPADLNALLSMEQAGKMRKALMAAISDEQANRVGKIGGPPPAKQPEEKEPIATSGGGAPADKDEKGEDPLK